MSAPDPGCVEACLCKDYLELFSLLCLTTDVANISGFRVSKTERKILRSRRTSEFSHSLEPQRKLDLHVAGRPVGNSGSGGCTSQKREAAGRIGLRDQVKTCLALYRASMSS